MNFGERFEKEIERQGFTEEQKEWLFDRFVKKVLRTNGYRIRIGEPCLCYRSTYNNNVFHKILIQKKDADGSSEKAYKNVKFVGCEAPKMEKSEIIIGSMFEDFYFRKGDRFNPQFTLVITDYKFVENSGAITYEQISEYKESVDYLTDNSFEIVGEPVNTIDEEDFPF